MESTAQTSKNSASFARRRFIIEVLSVHNEHIKKVFGLIWHKTDVSAEIQSDKCFVYKGNEKRLTCIREFNKTLSRLQKPKKKFWIMRQPFKFFKVSCDGKWGLAESPIEQRFGSNSIYFELARDDFIVEEKG